MAEITKNIAESRFELRRDGELAGWIDYSVAGMMGNVALTHTRVEERFGGQGLAGQLVQYALDDIRTEGYQVVPECSYVKRWIDKNPEYAGLVATPDHDQRS